MKKILRVIFVICLMLPITFAIAGCTQNPTQLTKANYLEAFNSVKTAWTDYVNSKAAPSALSYNVNDDDFVDANNNLQAQNMSKASLAMIYFVRNIYQNEDYEIKETFDDCIVADGTFTYNIRLSTTYSNDTNLISVKVNADYDNQDTLVYFVFDIDYNFNSKALNSFTILGYSGSKTNLTDTGVNYYKFENNNLEVLPHTADCFDEFATAVLSDLSSYLAPQRIENPANYSTEYMSAMTEAFN